MSQPVTIHPLRSADPLSKSRFMKGQQCPTALYYAVRTDLQSTPPTPADEARFAIGNQVGALARQRFEEAYGAENCRLITADHLHHREAVADTAAAMAAGCMAIFEAAFTFGGVKIRIDVLERVGDRQYDLIEVKSTGEYSKKKHLWDATVQTWVARGAGVAVRRVGLMHLDKTYLWPGGAYDTQRLLTTTDITDEVAELLPLTAAEIERLLAVVRADEVPPPPPAVSCTSPYRCEFMDRCGYLADGPEHPLRELPYCDPTKRVHRALTEAGFEDLTEIDEVTARATLSRGDQYWTWKATFDGAAYMLHSAEEFFAQVSYPLYFLDFETVNPALPLFVGTAPFEVIPVQYSVHVLNAPGATPEHREYIAEPGAFPDPRAALAEALLRDLGTRGTIMEWHGNGGYESARIEAMAQLYPALARDLRALNHRMLDLAGLVKESFFHKGFHGSYSIKVVLPTLVPDMRTYTSLTIHNGDEAAIALVRVLTDDDMPPGERDRIRRDLLGYCQLDTEAMVEVWHALERHRAGSGYVADDFERAVP